jgi:hypothetical protein
MAGIGSQACRQLEPSSKSVVALERLRAVQVWHREFALISSSGFIILVLADKGEKSGLAISARGCARVRILGADSAG